MAPKKPTKPTIPGAWVCPGAEHGCGLLKIFASRNEVAVHYAVELARQSAGHDADTFESVKKLSDHGTRARIGTNTKGQLSGLMWGGEATAAVRFNDTLLIWKVEESRCLGCFEACLSTYPLALLALHYLSDLSHSLAYPYRPLQNALRTAK